MENRLFRHAVSSGGARFAPAALLALPVLFGIVQAARGAWLCDDAFISFRYVDNWTRGLGLVFNAGERVEGYTHFLWIVLLAALHRLGFDMSTLGRYVPIIAWAALLAVLFVRSGPARPWKPGAVHDPWLALPIAAWGLALHHDARVYASGGLETSLFALLLAGGLLLVAAERPRIELAAVVYALAVLARPEGLLYSATAGAHVLWRWRSWREVGRFAAIWAALVAPWVAWKLVYYGTVLPNTYYAKSAALAHWSQGWVYTRLYFTIYAVLLVCLLIVVTAWLISWTDRRRGAGPARSTDLVAGTRHRAGTGIASLALVQVALTTLYVTRVGGDFMFARFYVPVTPLLYLAAEECVRRTRRRWLVVGAAVLIVGGTLVARIPRAWIFRERNLVHGITDEPTWYTPDFVQALRHQGEVLQRIFDGTEARIALPAARSMVAYFGRLPYAVEGTGLTDASIARQPIAERGRPGHERGVTDDYLHEHRVPLVLLWSEHRAAALSPVERLRCEDVWLRMVYYDRTLMERLAERPGVSFVDFPAYLDRYLDAADEYPAERLRRDFAVFDRFYFRHNDDPARRSRFATLVGDRAGR